MPIVVLTVDANTAGLTAGTEASIKQLGTLAEAIGKVAGETNTMASSVGKTMEAMNAGIASVGTALEQMITKIGGVKTAVSDLSGAVDAAASTQITRINAVGLAYDGVTEAIKRQVLAMRELSAAGGSGGGAGAVAAAESASARVRANRAYGPIQPIATGLGQDMGYLSGPVVPYARTHLYNPALNDTGRIYGPPVPPEVRGVDTGRIYGPPVPPEVRGVDTGRIYGPFAPTSRGVDTGRTFGPVLPAATGLGQDMGLLYGPVQPEIQSAATAARDAAAAERAAATERSTLARRGTALARAGATDLLGEGAAGAALGPGVLTGPAIAAAVAGFLGYKAVSASNAFQSAEQQTGAQINNLGVAKATGDAILAYSKTGGAPYNPTLVMQSIEPLLAHGYSQAAINAGIAPLEQLSAQNKAPDLMTAVNGVNTYLAIMGSGAKSTATQMIDAVNYMSKIETKTTIPPGDLSKVLPNLLIAAQQAGVSPDQAAGALIKIGTANANAPQDVTTIGRMMQEMLTKNTPGAIKEAASLGLVMGPGALAAYGGSFEAMVQAYANATAGGTNKDILSALFPVLNAKGQVDQGASIAQLFPTSGVRGGATAFRELIAGGGTQQALGYEADVANRAGTINDVYKLYSQGVNQQATQVMNQFNTEVIGVGSTLTTTVVPALLLLAKGALDAAGNLGGVLGATGNDIGKAKSWVDKNIPGGVGTLALGALPGGWLTALIKGAYDHAGDITGTVGAGIGDMVSGKTPGQQLQARMRAGVNYTSSAPGAYDALWYQTMGLDPNALGNGIGHAPGSVGRVGSTTPGVEGILPLRAITHRESTDYLSALVKGLSGAATATTNAGGIFDALGTVVSMGVQGIRSSLGPPTNAPVVADRSILSEMIAGGATTPRMYTQLAQVHRDLLNSNYTPEQQASIMRQGERQVFAAAVGPGDQMKIQAAQMNLDAATQMGEPPKLIRQYQDAYIAALNQYARDTQHGTQLAATLRGNAQTAEVYTYGDKVDAVNRSVKDMQNAIAIDKTQNNDAAAKADTQKLLAFQAKNAGILKLDPSDLALLKAQANADLYATASVVNTHPFFQKNAGLGAFAAGSGNTEVRVGGAVDPATTEIRLLRQELTAAQAMNTQLLQQIARNTGARVQAAGAPGAASGRYTTGR